MTIDTNVYLSRWPTRRLPGDETPRLVDKLRAYGVAQAWVGSFDALLHKDVAAVNARLADECAKYGDGLLVPFGCVNPMLPDWEDDLRRCHEVHKMPGIRLHPNYHGYKLDEPAFERLLAFSAERGLLVQIAVRMEDPRTQHRLLRVDDVDVELLIKLLPKLPNLRVQFLNALNGVRADALDRLITAGQVYVESAMLEGVGGISQLLRHVPGDRLLFGSYFPFFAWESAKLKLQESPLAEEQRRVIETTNAESLLRRP
jgi:predicted TIM-barrel fold metal-dependent hydrolase